MGEDECFITVHISSSTSICSLPQKQCLKQFPPLPLSPPNSLCHSGWPLNSFLLKLRPVFRTDIHLCIISKKQISHNLLLLTELLPMISPNVHYLSSLFLTLSEGQRQGTQQSKSIREERLSTRNPQLLDHKERSQCLLHAEGRVQSVCPNAKCNRKHKQRHACLPGVVVLLKSPDFNKLDKKYDIDEQQLFIYFITAVERSWNVLNANDKYLRY